MSDWRPDEEDPDDVFDRLSEAIGDTLDRRVTEYMHELFTEDFLSAYTTFTSWASMLRRAQYEREQRRNSPDYVEGRRHTEYVLRIRALEREGELEEAERLLILCCAAEESTHRRQLMNYFHERLAMLYEKQGRYPEAIAVCERFLSFVDPTGGEIDVQMGNRLRRLRKRRK